MRTATLLLALLPFVPATALAGKATGTLNVGVTVVAACPPGSGKPCSRPAAAPSAATANPPADTGRGGPVAVLRDDTARTLTAIY